MASNWFKLIVPIHYNKITKERLFVVEVDGIQFHEQNIKQKQHDEIKDKVLIGNQVPIYRFKTNESGEQARLRTILNNYNY